MYRKSMLTAFCFFGLISGLLAGEDFTRDPLLLKNGDTVEALTLSGSELSVTMVPALGGKIISLKDRHGNEYLSRSKRPYTARTVDMFFEDSEFDGIDELFPTLGACLYPSGPLKGREAPDHGELFKSVWKVAEGDGITLEATGINFPYRFWRQARIEENTLILDYGVTNTSDTPFSYLYIFHPLFKGTAGCSVNTAPDATVLISWSRKNWLGEFGSRRVLKNITDARKRPFFQHMFTANSGRYWKYYTDKLSLGAAEIHYADGSRIAMSWPADLLPYYAVWCSEGSMDDALHHIAIEPVITPEESLDKAMATGEARELPGGHTQTWTIRLTLTPPVSEHE